MSSIYDRWATEGPAFITHDPTRERCRHRPGDHLHSRNGAAVNSSAAWIIEQCQDAYEALAEAEEDCLKAGRSSAKS